VLNALTEHDIQGAVEEMAEALGSVHTHRKGTASTPMMAGGPKVSFAPDGSTSPRNYGYQCTRNLVESPAVKFYRSTWSYIIARGTLVSPM
jgi:hypothetical protein